MRKIGLDTWGGMIMLLLLLGIGSPVMMGLVDPLIPLGWWLFCFLISLGALTLSVWGIAPHRWAPAAFVVSLLTAWVVVATVPSGYLAIFLVVLVASAVYVIPFGWVIALIFAHTALLVVAGLGWGMEAGELTLHASLYAVIQFASALGTYSSVREQATRRKLAQANVELKAAQALLRESVQSAERLRISRDLHDSVGHSLTVLALELEAAKHCEADQVRPRVERAGVLARGLLDEVRATVSELRRGPTDLADALEQLVRDVPDLVVDLNVDSDIEVGERETVVLVRVVQEIVTNTLRHSEASTLSLKIYRGEGGQTVLDAADDGLGADDVQVGNGLEGLRERVEALHGTVRIDGSSGFRVTAQVPVV